jgi:Mn2+/Fe2+ NRAMP family transporter
MLTTRLLALIPCLALAVVFEATNTFDKVAQIINVIQSLVLPFGLIPVVQMTSSAKVMVREQRKCTERQALVASSKEDPSCS